MKKSTTISIILKSGVEAQVSIIREQGYKQTDHELDGIAYQTSEYADSADIKATIAKVGVNGQAATLEGSMLCTSRKVGSKMQLVKAQLAEEDAAAIAALASEILAPEDKAAYDAQAAEAAKAEAEHQQRRQTMRKAMGY